MKFPRVARLAAIASAACLLALPALAQDGAYPQKPIRMISPASAGSGQDILARRLAERLSKNLGQAVVVDNIPGAGGVIGAEALIKAPPDGYTLSFVTSNYTVFPHLYSKLRFDAVKDITAIAGVGASPMVLATRADFPANSVAELVAMAKKEPNKLTMGSSGNGTILHLVGSHMQNMAGIEFLHIPFKGAAPVVPEVASGSVDIGFFAYSAIRGLVESGKMKVLAVTGEQRQPTMPNIPTVGETIPGFAMNAWYAVVGPKDMPAPIVNRLNREITKVIGTQEFIEQNAPDSVSPLPMSPAATKAFIESDFVLQGKLVKVAGVSIQ